MSVTKPLLVALVLAAAAAPGALAARASAPPASLRDDICSPAVEPALRGLSTTAVMGSVPGTQSLRMRFELLRGQHAAGPYRVVSAPNLGHWIAPQDPTLGRQPGDVWTVSHPVVGLSRAGYYRLRVEFKWLGSDGKSLAAATHSSPACLLRELRPDLMIKSVTVAGAGTHTDAYTAVIRNRGLTATGAFEVQLRIAGHLIQNKTVAGLGAHARRRVRISAPACTHGQAVTMIVDPAHHIPDYDPANNALTVSCPTTTQLHSIGP